MLIEKGHQNVLKIEATVSVCLQVQWEAPYTQVETGIS